MSKKLTRVQELQKEIEEIQAECEHKNKKIIKPPQIAFPPMAPSKKFKYECLDCNKIFEALKTETCQKCLANTMECIDTEKNGSISISKYKCTTCRTEHTDLQLRRSDIYCP